MSSIQGSGIFPAPEHAYELMSQELTTPAQDDLWRGVYPLILTLDTHGVPHRWITWQHACYYYAKNQVAWALGEHAFTVYGGLNRHTGPPCGQPTTRHIHSCAR